MVDAHEGFQFYEETSTDPVIPLSLSQRCKGSRIEDARPEETLEPEPLAAKHNDEIEISLEPIRPTPYPDAHDDDSSMRSAKSSTSSVARLLINALLDSSPHSGPTVNRVRAHVEKLDIQLDEEDVPSGIEVNEVMPDTKSVGAASALSRLDHDEVSIRDAVDADDGTKTPPNPTENHVSIWRLSRWTDVYHSMLAIAEYDFEMRRLCKLALPFAIEALGNGLLETINIALIGRLIGTNAITAYVTVDLVVGLAASLLSGFQESLTTLCSQAIGARNKKLAGQYVQLSIVLFLVLWAPMAVVLVLYMNEIFLWFGFDEVVANLGTEFARIYVFVIAVDSVSNSIHTLLDTIDKETYSSLFGVGEELVATLAVLVTAKGPDPSLEKVGLAFVLVGGFGMVANVMVIMWKGWYDPYLPGIIGSSALQNSKAIMLMLKTSSSLSVGFVLAYGEWEVLTVFARFLGPAEVAAWAIMGALWDVVEDVTESVADACEVRVAMHLGASQPAKARMSSFKSIYIGTVIGVFLSSVLFIIGDNIPGWLTSDPTLQRLVAELIPLFGLGNVGLTIGTIAWTAVGAQGRYRLATAVGFGGSWLVTLPLAALCSAVLTIDLQGQTAAVVIGYMASGTVNSYLLFTSDWEELSREVIKANAEFSDDSSSSDSSSSSSNSSADKSDDGTHS